MNPIVAVFHKDKWNHIWSTKITVYIHIVVREVGPVIGFNTKDTSTRSLRAGGAMVLLTAWVEPEKIRLVER